MCSNLRTANTMTEPGQGGGDLKAGEDDKCKQKDASAERTSEARPETVDGEIASDCKQNDDVTANSRPANKDNELSEGDSAKDESSKDASCKDGPSVDASEENKSDDQPSKETTTNSEEQYNRDSTSASNRTDSREVSQALDKDSATENHLVSVWLHFAF